jgi:hypothetical protein
MLVLGETGRRCSFGASIFTAGVRGFIRCGLIVRIGCDTDEGGGINPIIERLRHSTSAIYGKMGENKDTVSQVD